MRVTLFVTRSVLLSGKGFINGSRPDITPGEYAEKGRPEVERYLSWKLSTDHTASRNGMPVLIHCRTAQVFGPSDIVQAYPSFSWKPAWDAVNRLAKIARLDEEGQRLVSRFIERAKR